MRVWHSPWSWLKLIVAAESVAGKTRTGMLTRLIFMNPFHVGLAAIQSLLQPLPGQNRLSVRTRLRGSARRRMGNGVQSRAERTLYNPAEPGRNLAEPSRS